MIIVADDDASYDSAMEALAVINSLRHRSTTYAMRPIMEDNPWVKTLWPNENYL